MWPFKPKQVALQVRITEKTPSQMRLSDFMADQELVRSAQEILANPTFKLMMQVCRNESPAFIAFRLDATLDSRALHQSKIEGYNMTLRNLEAMGEHKTIPEELAATFEPEERTV